MSAPAYCDRGSFRDPSGQVFAVGGRIYRTVNEVAKDAYEAVRQSGVIEEFVSSGKLVRSDEVTKNDWPDEIPKAAYLLEHEPIPYISYPYEWCFGQLKAAALGHLDLQLELLQRGIALSDATAYNVQFIGTKPVFIDTLSLRPYVEGEYWEGHRQFCEQFLNPLLLRARLGVTHNAWFRGNLEGIPTRDLARLLSVRHKLSWQVLSHVTLLAALEQRAVNAPDSAIRKARSSKRLPRTGYQGLLSQLRNWISRLEPADTGPTVWGNYAKENTYTSEESAAKRLFIKDFTSKLRPRTLIDLGCNTGDYSVEALNGGAEYVIGFDFDHRAVDLAYSRAVAERLQFLPLWLDAANPSPDQGWAQAERQGFAYRTKADAMVALAFEHHLAIGRNVPLPSVIDWLVGIAPAGIIEFVPKEDPTIQKMLSLRKDIFQDYNEETFAQLLADRAKIIHKNPVSGSGRVLYQYERSAKK